MTTIKIRDIAIYHPENQVCNDHYIEHFKKIKGEDYTEFITDVLGRQSRYIINNDDENSVTMAIEASKRVLNKSGLKADELDMIIFSSQVPEYTFPSNAVLVHKGLDAGTKTGVFDMNANCTGMTIALDQASRYLMSNPYMNRILLVGSDYTSLIADPEDSLTYPNFGDAACAVILEKSEEDKGFIDSIYYTNTWIVDKVTFPRNGLSKKLKGQDDSNYLQWLPFDGAAALPKAYNIIDEMLERNHMKIEDIDVYCLSQFSLSFLDAFQEKYQMDKEKLMYAGDKFGYTGTTSPLIAFHEGIQNGSIKRGDTVLFWTVGVGYNLIAVLFTY